MKEAIDNYSRAVLRHEQAAIIHEMAEAFSAEHVDGEYSDPASDALRAAVAAVVDAACNMRAAADVARRTARAALEEA